MVSGLFDGTVTVIFHKIKVVSLEAFVYDSSRKDVLGLYIHGYPYFDIFHIPYIDLKTSNVAEQHNSDQVETTCFECWNPPHTRHQD